MSRPREELLRVCVCVCMATAQCVPLHNPLDVVHAQTTAAFVVIILAVRFANSNGFRKYLSCHGMVVVLMCVHVM